MVPYQRGASIALAVGSSAAARAIRTACTMLVGLSTEFSATSLGNGEIEAGVVDRYHQLGDSVLDDLGAFHTR